MSNALRSDTDATTYRSTFHDNNDSPDAKITPDRINFTRT